MCPGRTPAQEPTRRGPFLGCWLCEAGGAAQPRHAHHGVEPKADLLLTGGRHADWRRIAIARDATANLIEDAIDQLAARGARRRY
jgi:hypothetical protein